MQSKTVFPNYSNSILNTITSILKYYNVNTKYKGIDELDSTLKNNFKNVVLILLDGMGENLLNSISPEGFFAKNKLSVVTSVCPSTTVAALNTYYSARPPIETGWIAWSQYFKEYGRALDMFPRTDSYTGEKLVNPKIDVFDSLKYKNIFEQIEDVNDDVKGYEINPTHCESRSNRVLKANSIEIMCDNILSLCKNTDNNFIFAYTDDPDKTLHRKGCSSTEVQDLVLHFENTIKKLHTQLENTNTLLIISADHGHNDIETEYNILDFPDILECLIIPPFLESRAISFFVKEDKKDLFAERFRNNFKNEFLLFTKEEFLKKEFLGIGNHHYKIDDFIGNYIAISIANSIIKLDTNISMSKYTKLSTHCGFTENEMLVPLIVLH